MLGERIPGVKRAAVMVKSALHAVGYDIIRYHPGWRFVGVEKQPATLIDIGCAYGTPYFYEPFPDAALFLIDPLVEYESHMRQLVGNRRAGGGYAIAALGAAPGTMDLNVALDLLTRSSAFDRTLLTAHGSRIERRQVPVATLDELIAKHRLKPPYGIKVDTEGFELEVIRGASATLRDALFVVAETSVQRRFVGSYDFADFITAMSDAGFRVGNILHAHADSKGIVRFMDVLYLPASSEAARPTTP